MTESRRILLVEDDALIAMDEEGLLVSAGFAVVGPVPTVASALELINGERFDGAVLDITLKDTTAIPVADALAHAGVPFLFVTGHSGSALPARHRHRPRVTKPYLSETLLKTARETFSRISKKPPR